MICEWVPDWERHGEDLLVNYVMARSQQIQSTHACFQAHVIFCSPISSSQCVHPTRVHHQHVYLLSLTTTSTDPMSFHKVHPAYGSSSPS